MGPPSHREEGVSNADDVPDHDGGNANKRLNRKDVGNPVAVQFARNSERRAPSFVCVRRCR